MPKVRGFTLIELLVVMGIIIILVGFLLPQLGSFDKYQKLKDEALRLESTLRKVQNNASSGVKCTGDIGASNWSLTFLLDEQSYQVQPVCSDIGSSPTPTPLPLFPTIYQLSPNVKIEKVEIDGCSGSLTTPKVIFDNISSKINFSALSSECNSVILNNAKKMTITFQLTSETSSKSTVIIEKGGAIYVSSN